MRSVFKNGRPVADFRALGRVIVLVGMGSTVQARWASARRYLVGNPLFLMLR